MKSSSSLMKKLVFTLFLFSTVYAQGYVGAFLYSFKDESALPEDQRNYMIEVSEISIHFMVQSKEDALLDETYPINTIQFVSFVKKLKACKLEDKDYTSAPKGCAGGSSDSFFFLWNGTTPWDGYMSQCKGKEYGNLMGKLDDARALFKSMVPDFSAKLASTKK